MKKSGKAHTVQKASTKKMSGLKNVNHVTRETKAKTKGKK